MNDGAADAITTFVITHEVRMENTSRSRPAQGEDRTIPLGQRLFDNMFLLLVAGIVIMVVVYTGWGLWELMTMPQGTLP